MRFFQLPVGNFAAWLQMQVAADYHSVTWCDALPLYLRTPTSRWRTASLLRADARVTRFCVPPCPTNDADFGNITR